ncbi:hypothetical protein PHYBLDRAFT_69679 [Phycomyces blakesleeanus NRRL 1555(-)]|uniref:Uncharacterized protein n=1 Tax=Phycomyces blakesleeanus (strain ATCC 8743b / DSM 1359 / FGSC 10004 / NBRC 33097 / NRRL 1555) TaxID=763407 RepID=A0A162Y5E7_PHYB8|nr:hypothetical protein PHYBLDRAFT_69679 [Phycomyces blakesleeanus NRRL 1555(-)]OAD78375.1 hypothetical protein PHYBLDRAFT_69679 [Phycomyces blakesleeanus NRRL 1555(-)]|eukprot:XP_018296415.1 hypothetical protein PHYBLDRAFT_69679 [Phycomyces blakesleeanus NRRL 1555(-)]
MGNSCMDGSNEITIELSTISTIYNENLFYVIWYLYKEKYSIPINCCSKFEALNSKVKLVSSLCFASFVSARSPAQFKSESTIRPAEDGPEGRIRETEPEKKKQSRKYEGGGVKVGCLICDLIFELHS